MTEIAKRIQTIRREIPQGVRLIAVSKTATTAAIREAYEAGVRDFGENRLQDALPKIAELSDLKDICWHYIGHLQSNKAKKVLEYFSWIHSVDRLSLARHLDRLAGELNYKPQVCLQVKILPDPDKYGWQADELLTDLTELAKLDRLEIAGLMVILPLGLQISQINQAFQATANLQNTIRERGFDRLQLTELSMGMSGDYLQAIEAGATMIRIGTTIFGKKN